MCDVRRRRMRESRGRVSRGESEKGAKEKGERLALSRLVEIDYHVRLVARASTVPRLD